MTRFKRSLRVPYLLLLAAAIAAVTVWTVPAAGLRAAEEPALVAPESVGMSTDRLRRIDTYIQEYIDTNQIAGAVTLVARRGEVVHLEAQGWRDKEAGQPMTTDTIFEMASMTKPIVSAALMMLFEEGRFLLDDPISKWLPEYADHKVRLPGYLGAQPVAAARPVTVRHVLTHTSGLTMRPGNRGLTPAQRDQVTNGGKGHATLRDHVRAAAVIPGYFHPGDEWLYGDSTNYVAVLVEEISGQSLDVFLRERIFEPLGMDDTFYYTPRDKVERVAAIYRPAADGIVELARAPKFVEPTRYFPGIAGLKSTALDYIRFAQMIANGGELDGVRLLGRMTINNMITNQIGALPVDVRGPGYGFGLGFGILTNPARAVDSLSVGSYTWGGAYGTLYWADPVEDLIGILLIQLRPYNHFNIRPMFSNVVTQAVVDSLADQRPKIMGHATQH